MGRSMNNIMSKVLVLLAPALVPGGTKSVAKVSIGDADRQSLR